MHKVFKSFELQNVIIRNIDVYGSIVLFNRRLSQEFVRKSLANCFVRVIKHAHHAYISDRHFYRNDVSYWLGCLVHRDNDLPAVVSSNGFQTWYLYGKKTQR